MMFTDVYLTTSTIDELYATIILIDTDREKEIDLGPKYPFDALASR